jgi:hypothetical protein
MNRARAESFILEALLANPTGKSAGRLPRELPAQVPEKLPERESELGRPLDVKQVAELIGCSPSTVRRTLLPRGLPCFRCSASSKLIFYQVQVVGWLRKRQKLKGGITW